VSISFYYTLFPNDKVLKIMFNFICYINLNAFKKILVIKYGQQHDTLVQIFPIKSVIYDEVNKVENLWFCIVCSAVAVP
jgi:hypothetical protein